jgi:hypothetical protein
VTRASGPAAAVAIAVAGVVLGGGACAHQAGAGATRGAAQVLNEKAAAQGQAGTPPLAVAAQLVTKGSLSVFDDPKEEQRLEVLSAKMAAAAVTAALEAITSHGAAGGGSPVEAMAAQAARTFEAQLVAALGAQGNGPLARTLTTTADQVAAAAARGAASNLLPGCDPRQTPGCVERQISELAQITGAGVARGVKQELRWALLIAVFAAGFLVAMAGVLLWQMWTTRRALREARALGLLRRPVEQE